MQTFLPYSDFVKSAQVLDSRRLGKQRVETLQILRALHGFTKGWRNHPATVMWSANVNSLVEYGVVMCETWLSRGYKDTVLAKLKALYMPHHSAKPPYWLGMPELHVSHQSNLLRKDPVFYGQYGWNVPHNLPYFWPKPCA
jgi:hypothetical protein